jgi:hypothetical protein
LDHSCGCGLGIRDQRPRVSGVILNQLINITMENHHF